MQDIVEDFLREMEAHGYKADEKIIANDEKNRIRVNGEKSSSFVYQLKIDGDMGVGWFLSFKEGVTHKYTSKSKKEYTPEERAAFKKKIAAERRVKEKQIKEARQAAAQEAKRIWALASKTGEHEYITRKDIGVNGVRIWQGGHVAGYGRDIGPCVVVPAYKGRSVTSLQFILNDGSKLFLPGGELQGAYAAVKDEGLTETLYICEGYATAYAVYQITGCTSVVAFNCGNLKAVSDTMREKYPEKEIIIAADNDANTNGNPGITKAKETGYKYTAPPVHGDWHDYLHAEGMDNAREQIAIIEHDNPVSQIEGPPADAYDEGPPPAEQEGISDDWREGLVFRHTKEGPILDKTNINNLVLFFRHHEQFNNRFFYDEFNKDVMCVSGERMEKISDHDYAKIALECERFNINKQFDNVKRYVDMVANERKVNPAKEYLDALQWDGTPRLKEWLSYYLGATDEPKEYLAAIGEKWLTAAVKRVYEAGCKFDHVLVIEGEQSLGKSTALRELATFGDTGDAVSYFTDQVTLKKIGDKDSIQITAGCIIVELAELVGFNKSSDDELKQWITSQVDKARLAYGRTASEYPRMFVLAGTTNNYEYLKDPTGNRRFWPFRCYGVDIEAIQRDRVQLWAEAVHNYKSGMYIGLESEEYQLALVEQQKRMECDPWLGDVASAIDDMMGLSFTVSDVMRQMGMQLRDKDKNSEKRIRSILKDLGYENRPEWDAKSGKSVRKWSK